MNNDLLMNDTFENLHFTQNGNFSSQLFSDILTDFPKTSVSDNKKPELIFFDDSVFLSQILSTGEKHVPPKTKNHEAERFQLKEEIETSMETSKINTCEKQICDYNKEIIPIITNINHIKNTVSGKTVTNSVVENKITKIENNDQIYRLSSWGLPKAVLEKYELKNLRTMFHWQFDCLSKEEVLNGKNLVYSAPTSAGKTLVAEILAIKTILEHKKKVIFILPFVSIVREKMYYFQDLLETSGIRVDGFMGSYNPPGGFASIQFAICTIEKANSLINRLLEEGKLRDIGAVLIDEIHLLGDSSRGYLLELLLTKLRYVSKKEDLKIQIIGMSATLPNLHQMANWLDAELYTTDFRPVPLNEQAQVCGDVFDKNMKLMRKLTLLPELKTDSDNILQLCLETIKESCSVLIFCPTKNWCENLAQQISTGFYKIGSSQSSWGELLRAQLNTNLIMELLEQLKYCPVGLDAVLCKTVSFGVAFHHAGLTMDERDIIEGAFRNGTLRVLVATSTLSSGVNLPARRVIIRTPIFHGKPLDSLVYRQMIGRAGRMGKDTVGESFLVCQKNDYKIAKDLMSAELTPVKSCLESAGKLKRAILEVVASGVASDPDDIQLFTDSTLLAAEDGNTQELQNPIEEAVSFLQTNEFIRLQKGEDGKLRYVASSLGKACLSSSISPDEGLSLFTELEKARQCLVLETELHLVYLVTPYSACYSWENLDWMLYLDIWERLPVNMKKVGELVGVRESYLVNATRGKIQTNTGKLYHKFLIHKRFFVALALQDLVNEKPLNWVCKKFNCNRGMLQSLQQSSSSFAGMVTAFSKQLGWSSIELLLSQFQERMQFGVSRDLLDLMHMPVLNGKMARALYNAGIESIIQLANSEISAIENILHRVVPFESEKDREGETEYEKKQRNKYKNVWITGKEGLTEKEAAEIFVKDARKYLKIEMGLVDAKWKEKDDDSDTDSEADGPNKKTKGDSFFSENSSLFSNNISDTSSISNADSTKIEDPDEIDYVKETSNKLLEKFEQCSLNSPKKLILNAHNEPTTPRSITVQSNNQTELTSIENNKLTSIAVTCSTLNRPAQDVSTRNKYSELKTPTTQKKAKSKLDFSKKEMNKCPELTTPQYLNIEKMQNKTVENKLTDKLTTCCSNEMTSTHTELTEREKVVKVNTNLLKSTQHQNTNNRNKYTECFTSRIQKADVNTEVTDKSLNKPPTDLSKNEHTRVLTELNVNDTELILKNTELTLKKAELTGRERSGKDIKMEEKDVNSILKEISLSDFSETLSENSNQTQTTKSTVSTTSYVSNVSDLIDTPSVELNISDSSVLNNSGVSLEKMQSDQSLFEEEEEDSFTLQLSANDSEDSDRASRGNCVKLNGNEIGKVNEDLLESAFRESSGLEDDILGNSLNEEEIKLRPLKKRKHSNGEFKLINKKHKSEIKRSIVQGELSDDMNKLEDQKFVDFSKMEIVNVCQELEVLERFCEELKRQESFSFSIGCSRIIREKPVIGMNIVKTRQEQDEQSKFHDGERKVEGVSFCWNDNVAYYLSLENAKLHQKIVKLLKSVFVNPEIRVRMMESKEQIKVLIKCCGLKFNCKIDDPKVADWMLDPEGKEKNLKALAIKYCPESTELAQLSGGCKGVGSVALDLYSTVSAKIRASLESVIIWHLTDVLKNILIEENVKYADAYDLETSTIICLAKMELEGINISKSSLTLLLDLIKSQINNIEKKAYSLAGRKFNFVSSTDVAKVIGMFRGKKTSTRKQILEKNQHPVSELVLQWRKLHSIVTKTIYPLVQVVENDRIHGNYITHTATGRISMHEPNLQNINNDFDLTNCLTKETVRISCRRTFEAPEDCVLLSADYCQLELRILTHFSQDALLCKIMREPGDVFKTIAAKWNRISEQEVTESIRQNAKHLCYGIIYGMGNRTLAEQLSIDEHEAFEFMETFRNTYPGIKNFIKDAVNNCKTLGYVETINGRRRYLPEIDDKDPTKKSKAERQAVNTIIQGSAADVVKKAMIKVECELQEIFNKSKNRPKMVLHLHDEVMYEVPTKYLRKVAKVVKKNMENSVGLSVPFPVKLKSGSCWGDMSEFFL